MAASTYPLVIPKVLAHEGGYVNHPDDPGGATNRGVTQGTYDGWRQRQGLPKRSVKQITSDEVAAIYRRDYWDKVRGDDLPAGPDYATFDAGVNSGPKRAATWLQQLVGADVDGRIGGLTIAAAHAVRDQAGLVKAYCRKRLGFMQSLRIWSTFGKGWARRVAEVEAFAVKLALAAVPGTPTAHVRAELHDNAVEAKKEANADATKAGGSIVVGTGGQAAEQPVGGEIAQHLGADPGFVGFVIIAGGIALIVAGVVFGVRWWANRARAKAYEQEARRT